MNDLTNRTAVITGGGSGIGAMINEPQPFGVAGSFFGEDQGLYVVTLRDDSLADFMEASEKADVVVDLLGRTIRDRIVFELEDADAVITLDELRQAHEGFFPKLMGEDAALA